jgi:hypothetical protein
MRSPKLNFFTAIFAAAAVLLVLRVAAAHDVENVPTCPPYVIHSPYHFPPVPLATITTVAECEVWFTMNEFARIGWFTKRLEEVGLKGLWSE